MLATRMAEGGITELYLADIPDDGHGSEEYWMNLDGSEAALALKLRLIVEQGCLSAQSFCLLSLSLVSLSLTRARAQAS